MKNFNLESIENIAIIMNKYNVSYMKLENDNSKLELKHETCSKEKKLVPEVAIGTKEEVMTSPLVGIFYRRESPNSKPFVEVGDRVKKGDTICLIEAMKTFTEITADFDGQITEICAEDGSVIEFSQPLFKYIS